MVRTLLNIYIGCHSYYNIIMCIDELFVFSRYHVLHSLDVFHCNQVAWVGHRGMAVFLLVQYCQLFLLVGHEDDLVVHHRLHSRYVVYHRKQVYWHTGVVHFHIGIWTDDTGQIGAVYIYQTVHFTTSVAHANGLFIHLESSHTYGLVPKVHGKETVYIFLCLLLAEEGCL